MLKSNKKLWMLPLLTLLLVGCKGAVKEVYGQGEFHTTDFLLNYYKSFPSEFKEAKYTSNEHVFNLTTTQFRQSMVNHLLDTSNELEDGRHYSRAFEHAIMRDYNKGLITFDDMINTYGDNAAKGFRPESLANMDTYNQFIKAMRTSSNNTWKNYGEIHRLSAQHKNDNRINDYFRYGMFSKLTEGLLECDGSGSLVRMQISEDGFGKKFDYELVDYHSLTLSLRGGTNIPWDNSMTRVTTADINLKVSFYIEETISNDSSKVTLNIPISNLETDNSSRTNIIHIYFDDIPGFTDGLIKRMNGMSIGFELVNHNYISNDAANEYEFAVMMYEVMFPYSLWN